jgi:hypothetical protein
VQDFIIMGNLGCQNGPALLVLMFIIQYAPKRQKKTRNVGTGA